MKTVLVTGPAVTPVSVDEAKAHARITDDAENAYVETLINAAVGHVEDITGRKLINQTWKLLLDDWPGDAEIEMPFGKTQSVASITYKDVDGAISTWEAANYVVDVDSVPGRVVIGYDKSWPTDQLFNVNPISVQFVSGYGAAGTDVPAQLLHAIKLLVAHWYENRETVIVGQTIANIPTTIDALIWPFRLFRF